MRSRNLIALVFAFVMGGIRLVGCGSGTSPVVISGTLPMGGTVGTAYTGSLTASGGNGNYTWSVTGLPPGVMSSGTSTSTLALAGTPTTAGTFTVAATVSDTKGNVRDELHNGDNRRRDKSNLDYGHATGDGNSGHSVLRLADGERRDFALHVDSDGAAGGRYAVKYFIGDGDGQRNANGVGHERGNGDCDGLKRRHCELHGEHRGVGDSVKDHDWRLLPTDGLGRNDVQRVILGAGGRGTLYLGGKRLACWGLPDKRNASAKYSASGTPTTAASYDFVATVTDSASNTVTYRQVIAISSSSQTVTIGGSFPATGTVGTTYTGSITATGGTAPYTWTVKRPAWWRNGDERDHFPNVLGFGYANDGSDVQLVRNSDGLGVAHGDIHTERGDQRGERCHIHTLSVLTWRSHQGHPGYSDHDYFFARWNAAVPVDCVRRNVARWPLTQ